jgi:hypothetical protein
MPEAGSTTFKPIGAQKPNNTVVVTYIPFGSFLRLCWPMSCSGCNVPGCSTRSAKNGSITLPRGLLFFGVAKSLAKSSAQSASYVVKRCDDTGRATRNGSVRCGVHVLRVGLSGFGTKRTWSARPMSGELVNSAALREEKAWRRPTDCPLQNSRDAHPDLILTRSKNPHRIQRGDR